MKFDAFVVVVVAPCLGVFVDAADTFDDDALNLLQLQHQNKMEFEPQFPIPGSYKAWPIDEEKLREKRPKFGPDGTWATPYCPGLQGCEAYCPAGCNGIAYWEPWPYRPNEEVEKREGWQRNKNLANFIACHQGSNAAIQWAHPVQKSPAPPGWRGIWLNCFGSENSSKPLFWDKFTTMEEKTKYNFDRRPECDDMGARFHEFCPVGCEDDCATFKFGNFYGCGSQEPKGVGYGFTGYNGVGDRSVGPNRLCQENNVVGDAYLSFLWCGKPTTTTTTDSGHVCRHYESEDTCPSQRCNWDGDACADPPCSSHTSKDDCCGDCEWEAGQCQPAIFKACPDEGKAGTNVCPEGCTFVDNCEQCEFAAGVWKKDYSGDPWPQRSGSRPQGCFRNRKFNIKCNKFEPGSKYPSGVDKVGTKKGKWPICKLIEAKQQC